MRAVISRRTTVTVKAVTHYVSDPSKVRKRDGGAYAVNDMVILLNYPEHTEEVVCDMLDKLSKESKSFYNLNKLRLYTPYAVYNGEMLDRLLSLESPYTELDINMFAFHSGVPGSWANASVAIKKLSVTFHDGVAYPNAGTELLAGIENNKTIENIKIWNYSPYVPKINISAKVKNHIGITHGVEIEYTSSV